MPYGSGEPSVVDRGKNNQQIYYNSVLRDKTEGVNASNSFDSSRYESVRISYRMSADKSAFELQFQIYNQKKPGVILGQGGITIAKP